jgi:hypothetical protein
MLRILRGAYYYRPRCKLKMYTDTNKKCTRAAVFVLLCTGAGQVQSAPSNVKFTNSSYENMVIPERQL